MSDQRSETTKPAPPGNARPEEQQTEWEKGMAAMEAERATEAKELGSSAPSQDQAGVDAVCTYKLKEWLDGKKELSSREVFRLFRKLSLISRAENRKATYKKLDIKATDFDAIVDTSADEEFDPVKATVEEVREKLNSLVDDASNEAAKKRAETIAWEWLSVHAKAFSCGGLGYLLPENGEPIAVTKDGQDFNVLLISLGIHPGSPMRDRIGEYIGTMCYEKGIETQARVSFHYDKEKRTAYFAEGRGKLMKVSGREIVRVPNGTDDQLFLFGRNYEPWEFSPPSVEPEKPIDWSKADWFELSKDLQAYMKQKGTISDPIEELSDPPLPGTVDLAPDNVLLADLLFGILEFENQSLSIEELHVLLNAYVVTLFMPGIVTGKLLLQVLGETGSAKTLFLRLLGRIIYGRKFEVTGMDEEQFENALVNNAFLVLDDVKSTSNKAILGKIRLACTGGSAKRRELYSTFGQIEMPYLAAVALSCSDEPFTASDEMSNRSLILRVKQREDYIAEDILLRRIDRARSLLLSEMMVRIQNVIIAVDAQANFEPKVKMRMASFATLILRVGRHFEWTELAEATLESWREEQEGASMDNTIIAVLDAWMSEESWKSEELSSGELYQKLSRAASFLGITPWWQGKENWLIRNLVGAARAYRNRYGFSFTKRTSGHKPARYSFKPKDEVLEELRASKPEQF
jgi:hypothetical protein